MRENQFREWVRRRWKGWISSYEPRRGSTIGIPDLQIIVCGIIVPIELKVGTVVDGELFCHDIRPAQIQWHRSLREAGARSFFLVGESSVANKPSPDRVFIFDGIEADIFANRIVGHAIKTVLQIDVKDFDDSLLKTIALMTK